VGREKVVKVGKFVKFIKFVIFINTYIYTILGVPCTINSDLTWNHL
jgi:hypothetical protein